VIGACEEILPENAEVIVATIEYVVHSGKQLEVLQRPVVRVEVDQCIGG